ncbi:MAG: nucleotidyl transferase AbiEii/AbiGii toxin family protein [Oscillospiraceae bacterium]|nr:nucleotidyl transferase AbiEii/AbiGii toxin family protein [Oscillospiraceae bacterium]
MEYLQLEKEMYQVMTAICNSNIPISFKGAMVLHAFLYESGIDDQAVRPTRDIDANWLSDVPPTMEEIQKSLQRTLDENDIHLTVKAFRDYGNGRSAGFEFCDPKRNTAIFSMDMDINRPEAGTRIYEVGDFKFRGIIVEQILADKILVISTDKVFRRIKDVIDLYYLSKCFQMEPEKIKEVMRETGRLPSSFDSFLNRKVDLEHAFKKFRFGDNIQKPDFNDVYVTVAKYIAEFIID